MDNEKKPTAKKSSKVATIVGIVLCVILIPILIVNITMIIDSLIHKDEVPGFFGMTPMIVMSGSMEPQIMTGDLIIDKSIDADDVEMGDVITFFNPKKKQEVITHKVIDIEDDGDGTRTFITHGINNTEGTNEKVPEENLIGIYWFRIPKLGDILFFMQTTTGLIVCIGIPLILLVGYEILRRFVYEKKNKSDMDNMMAELEALRAEKERLEAQAASDTPADEETPPTE